MKNTKMKKRIKQYSNYEFSVKEYIDKKYKKGDEYVIQLDIKTFEDFIEPYSESQPILKKEIGEYIERVSYDIPAYVSISIQLVDYFTEEEKKKIEAMINSYFGLQVGDKIIDLERNSQKAIILFVVGIMILWIFLILSYQKMDSVILEIMSITGSFAIWEFVNTIWLERGSLHIGKMNSGQLATAKIEFLKK